MKTPPKIIGGVHKKIQKLLSLLLQSKFYSFVLNIADAFARHQFCQLDV